MPQQPPLLLIENLLDTIGCFPGATLVSSSELVGREGFRAADYRRERSWWQPTIAGDRAHLDASSNVAGGADQRVLTQAAAGTFQQANTSHTWAILFRSSGAATGVQRLVSVTASGGAVAFGIYRAISGRLGYLNNAAALDFGAGAATPTDDLWHTFIIVLDAVAPLATAYLDGVAVGTAAYAPQQIGGPTSQFWLFAAQSAFTQATTGRLGRVLYYDGPQNAAAVANIHTTLITEDRNPANPSNNTTRHAWDPLFDQGTQQLTDRGATPTAHLLLGRTSGVEISPLYDPYWAGGAWVGVDLGAATVLAPDYVWIDRGHNLWGGSIAVDGTPDATFATSFGTDRAVAARFIPSLDANGNYVVGGDPTTGVCVTEEGALYMLFTAPTANRAWRVRFPIGLSSFTPVVPGIMLGRRHQLLNFSTSRDEDAGGRKVASEESDAGWLGNGKAYAWRTVDLGLKYIGAAEYDTTIRDLRRLLFERNQPAVVAMEYGTYPQRAWLYQLDGRAWANPMERVLRSGRLTLREVGPRLG